jgi:hypothetical protein
MTVTAGLFVMRAYLRLSAVLRLSLGFAPPAEGAREG